MGFWKKEEHVHFERDEEGRVIKVVRNEHPEPLHMKTSRQLEKEYYEKHPTPHMVRKLERKKEREAYLKAKHEARMKRMGQLGTQAGRTTMIDRLDSFSRGFSPAPYKTRGNFNPFGSTFDRGMKPMRKPSKPKKGKGYVIKGGKAYEIVKPKSRKRKKSKRKRGKGRDVFSWDFGDWG